MSKLKEKIYNLFSILKKVIEKFPFTIFAIIILTLIYAFSLDNNFISGETLKNISIFFTIFASSAFLVETLIEGKTKSKIVYYIISTVFAGLITVLTNVHGKIFGMTNEIFMFRLVRFIVSYFITIVTLGIYYNYKKSKKTLEEYLTKTVIGLFKTTLVYGILAIGIAIITAIFIYLILNGNGYVLIARMEILLLGIYYIPTIIYTIYSQEEETGKFAKIVIKYVLGGLVVIAFAIIYMYIIKIIVLRDMPSNQIFRILSALFIVGLPIWTMSSYWNDENYYDKINKKLPMFFIPFVFLQIYSIAVRILANGITEPRYMCVMLVIFEIIYLIIYIKNKKKIENVIFAFILITIVTTIVPFINMFYISNLSQYNNLKIYHQKQQLTEEDKSKIYGAYTYLNLSTEGKKYIQNLSKDEIDEITNYTVSNKDYNRTKYIYLNDKTEYIKIEGYKKLYQISASGYDENKKIDELFNNTNFEIQNSDDEFEANILPVIYECIEQEDQELDEGKEVKINDDKKIVLNSISISYDTITNSVDYYDIQGILLEK